MQPDIKVYGWGSQGFPTVFLIAGQLNYFTVYFMMPHLQYGIA